MSEGMASYRVSRTGLEREHRNEHTSTFGELLRCHRVRLGLSRNALAVRAGVNSSYLTRIENGERAAPQPHIVDALARELRLPRDDRDALFALAGYLPPFLSGRWDPALGAVGRVLTSPFLTDADRARFRAMITDICDYVYRAERNRAIADGHAER